MLNSENKCVLAGIGQPHAIEAVMETPVAFVGVTGEDGATFIPEVSEDGYIRWTNDKGLDNPQPVYIKGPQGQEGAGIAHIYNHGDVNPGYTTLKIMLTNGSSYEVRIPNGANGINGIGINNIFTQQNDDGRLVLVIQYNDVDYTLQRIVLPIYETGITSLEQTTGDSETAVMSQKAVTDELEKRYDVTEKIACGIGNVRIDDYLNPNNLMNIKLSGATAPTSTRVTVWGRNLIPYPYVNTTKEIGDLKISDNSDGTLTLNGSNGTSTAYFNLRMSGESVPFHLKKGKYTFSMLERENDYLQMMISFANSNACLHKTLYCKNYSTFTLNEDTDCSMALCILAGGSFDDVTIYPQLEWGEQKGGTDYVPYQPPVEYSPDVDGEISAIQYEPTVTILTDDENAELTVKYSRDVNKVFDGVKQVKNIEKCLIPTVERATVIDDFQSLNGWVAVKIGSYEASITEDTTDFLCGEQSIKFDNCIQRDNFPIKVGDELRVRFKINSIDAQTNLVLYISEDSNFSNYGVWTIYSNDTNTDVLGQNTIVRVGEWAEIVLPWSSLENTACLEKASVFSTLRFKFIDARGGSENGNGNANVQLIVSEPKKEPKGILTITFDDGCISQYTKAAKILGARGLKATAYIIHDIVGDPEFSNCVSEEQIVSLKYDYGWDIEGHWKEEMRDYSEEQLKTAFQSVKDWIKERGLGECEHFSYAGGYYEGNVEKIARRYFKTARTIAGMSTRGITSTKQTNFYRIPSVTAVSDTGTSSIERVLKRITDVAKYGGWLILTFHHIGDTATGMYCSEKGFARILDHAIKSGIEIKTVAEAMRGIV